MDILLEIEKQFSFKYCWVHVFLSGVERLFPRKVWATKTKYCQHKEGGGAPTPQTASLQAPAPAPLRKKVGVGPNNFFSNSIRTDLPDTELEPNRTSNLEPRTEPNRYKTELNSNFFYILWKKNRIFCKKRAQIRKSDWSLQKFLQYKILKKIFSKRKIFKVRELILELRTSSNFENPVQNLELSNSN